MLPVFDDAARVVASATRMDLEIPPPKLLTAKEDLLLAQKASARNPDTPAVLLALTSQLIYADNFDEAIALLEASSVESFARYNQLHNAYIGLHTEVATMHARHAAERAVELAETAPRRATALGGLAKTYTRFGELARAEDLLRQSLELDPHNKDAYKRLSRMLLHLDTEGALRLAYRMMEGGVLHARVLGSVVAALTCLGRLEEAHAFEALDAFLLSKTPEPPAGWNSLEAFTGALSDELLNHPNLRMDRYGTASTNTWRVDDPALHRSRVFPHLQQLIRKEVLAYVDGLHSEHPLARACPAKAVLKNWVVVTEGDGHETWHVHQNGWMSGVYYIHVQDHITQGTGPEGCLLFGMSEEIVGEAAAHAYGERLVRPHTGLMMLFPSHSFHKTCPHRGEGRRICFAFDINAA